MCYLVIIISYIHSKNIFDNILHIDIHYVIITINTYSNNSNIEKKTIFFLYKTLLVIFFTPYPCSLCLA